MDVKIPMIIFIMIPILFTGIAIADDNSCEIAAPTQDDIWVIIYDADRDGNRGNVIWKGKLDAGQKLDVTSTDGHIRYQYAFGPDKPYQGDTDRWCDQNNTIQLP